jgi:hypothetical protein
VVTRCSNGAVVGADASCCLEHERGPVVFVSAARWGLCSYCADAYAPTTMIAHAPGVGWWHLSCLMESRGIDLGAGA